MPVRSILRVKKVFLGKSKQSSFKTRSLNTFIFASNSGMFLLFGPTGTGGFGITLTAASTMIYYSNGYDLEKRLQSEARIDRIGQTKPMTYIDLVAEDTIDIKIQKALRTKMNIANDVMGEELKSWI